MWSKSPKAGDREVDFGQLVVEKVFKFSQHCNLCEYDSSQAHTLRMHMREGDFGQLVVVLGKVGPPVLSLGPRRASRGGKDADEYDLHF